MMAVIQIIHILASILLIGLVLLQGGENVDITAAFGGVSQAAFGPRGSVTLAIHASRSSSGSVLEHAPVKSAPVIPASPAPARPAPAAPAKK